MIMEHKSYVRHYTGFLPYNELHMQLCTSVGLLQQARSDGEKTPWYYSLVHGSYVPSSTKMLTEELLGGGGRQKPKQGKRRKTCAFGFSGIIF